MASLYGKGRFSCRHRPHGALDHHVDLVAVPVAEVEERQRIVAPARLPAELLEDERLQEPAQQPA
jgi:hypothetical protein